MTSQSNSYDELPYPGSPFPQTHPDRLATIATLFGMAPANVETCRVLELGCTDGGNLIPMAVAYPDARFIGIDLSQRQIADGQRTIDAIGLTNIQLIHQDILEVNEQYGQFDYIIAHGVFSWVPPAVQEKMLAVTKQLLNSQGVGYISYNTYPGWHMRGMLRDMMLFHTRQFSEPQKRIEQARALIDFLANAVPSQSDPYGLLLTSELESMQSWADSYIFHESLEAHNDPIYFHQFAERASQHGLRYLGEASLSAMLPNDLDEHVARTLNDVGRDIIEMEQYMDFVRNRTFRQTLLVHDSVELDRTLSADIVNKMQIRANLAPASEHPDPVSPEPVQFEAGNGTTITVRTPIQKAAFLTLASTWPATHSFDELLAHARAAVHTQPIEFCSGESFAKEAADLREAIFQCFCDHVAEFHQSKPMVTTTVDLRPHASPLARLQAVSSEWATTLFHTQVQLDVINTILIQHMDGSRTKEDLLQVLLQATADGTIVATQRGDELHDPAGIESALKLQIEQRLQQLSKLGLLFATQK